MMRCSSWLTRLYSSVATLPTECEVDDEDDGYGRPTAFTLARVPVPGEWADRGACREAVTTVFFPHYGDSTEEAKTYCARCPVLMECREFAIQYPMLRGIWGGMNERERKKLRWQKAS
jgi:WhiB family transcriptional regulator, redox-sensing transcriptional regulator